MNWHLLEIYSPLLLHNVVVQVDVLFPLGQLSQRVHVGLEALHGEGGRWEWRSGPRPQGGAGPPQRPAAGGKGYLLYTDNFYSSPALFRELTERGFGACGTARKDRRGIPASIRHTGLKKGEIVSSVDDGVLSLKWRDKRDVTEHLSRRPHGREDSTL